MTLELTEQQRQMMAEQPGRPLALVDPVTLRTYVLIASEQFEKVRPLLENGRQHLVSPVEDANVVPPGILRSQQAYWRDLPELLKRWRYRGRWVCYHDDERIGIAKTKTE